MRISDCSSDVCSSDLAFVDASGANIAATVTPQHLIINRNALFAGGLRPHAYCLPVAKREQHRLAVRRAATSGSPKFFLGTDSAPHAVERKEGDCGCAGIFNAPFLSEERLVGKEWSSLFSFGWSPNNEKKKI